MLASSSRPLFSPYVQSYNLLIYSLAFSPTVPIFSFGAYFLRTDSLWYCRRIRVSSLVPIQTLHRYHTFQNCLLASFPATRFKILAPPGCSSTKPVTSYTVLSMMMYMPSLALALCLATSASVNVLDMLRDVGVEMSCWSSAGVIGQRWQRRERLDATR